MRNRNGAKTISGFSGNGWFAGGMFLLAFAVLVLSTVARAETITGLKGPAAVGKLTPGLAVEYIHYLVRHVDECESAGKGKPGEPLSALDWPNSDQEVLTSSKRHGVCARITGFINLAKAGTYTFTINSNDGVRLLLGEQKVIEDPDVHVDRFSDYVPVQVSKPGWYPLYLIYFQRKGTTTLELYWKEPDGEDFVLVPEAAFGFPG